MAKVRGTSKGLSRAVIAHAAIALVDRHGLDALTMRALGEALGVRAMSLYRYVANKDDLLDAMQESIVAEMPIVDVDLPWSTALEAMARSLRAGLARHPNAIPLFVRPAATEGVFAALERPWSLMMRAGFGELDALRAVHAMLAYVVGQAMWQFGPDGDRGTDDEFEFGLEVLLLGLAAKAPPPPA